MIMKTLEEWLQWKLLGMECRNLKYQYLYVLLNEVGNEKGSRGTKLDDLLTLARAGEGVDAPRG